MRFSAIRTCSFVKRYGGFAAVFLPLLFGFTMEMQSADRLPSLRGIENFSAPAHEGSDLLGVRFDKWEVGDWINSEPLTPDSLRGKVVLVRWWTAPTCQFCEASAPALNEFSHRYRDRGLVVLGLYHHKSETPLTVSHVKEQARKLGFTFPVAIDPQWTTLRRWWLDKHDRGWTSITLLLDRQGIIRHVHPGGAFFKGEKGYEMLQAKIESLLAEPSK